MRKILLFLSLALFIFNAQSQNYMISFAGTGATNTIDSIKVENLTQLTSVKLTGGDDLQLLGSGVGINNLKMDDGEFKVRVYPNPMTNYSNIEFDSPVNCNASFEIFDITGRLIIKTQSKIMQDRNIFRVSGLGYGIYSLRINADNYSYTCKLISYSFEPGAIKINCQKQNIKSYNSGVDSNFDNKKINYKKGSKSVIQMQYNDGELLKITGYSANYSTIVIENPDQSKIITFNFIPCTDGAGNNYSVVEIGSLKSGKGKQVWMAENMKTAKYFNGDDIPNITDDNQWNSLLSGAYCWNNNNNTNENAYGKLYNWYAVADGRGICPTGWHIPSESDWNNLISYLGGENVAGGKMKETGFNHWISPNTGATNESGFSALPGGDRETGYFGETGSSCFLWSSTQYSSEYALGIYISANYSFIGAYNDYSKNYGFSVRCLLGAAPAFPVVKTDSVTGITSSSAISGGNVLYDGGASVTSRGVCWDTLPHPTIEKYFTNDGEGTGSFISNITGLKVNTTYYVRAYATNSVGTAYGDEYSFTTAFTVGETLQGGIVAYILKAGDPGYIEGENHGFIVAPTDLSTSAPWGCYGTSTGATSPAIGAGKANTEAIVASCTSVDIAARLCYDLDINGYNDWYLPSSGEMTLLFQNKESIGGFAGPEYWTSTEGGSTYAWTIGMIFGDFNNNDKDSNYYVRAIRSF